MIKYLLLLFFIPLSLLSRENPFFPVNNAEDIPLTSNQVEQIPALKRATVKLPSTARILKSVTVEYKNLDGSISKKRVELNNAIDWHLPLFISQNYNISRENREVKNIKNRVKSTYKRVLSLPFIKFYENDKLLKIVTHDKMLRDFLLVKPHRIVCDFRRQTDIRSYVKKLPKSSRFKKIRIGTHKGYYRVVIELDGYYQYKTSKSKGAYIFQLI